MKTTKGESIDAHEGGGSSCSSDEVLVMRIERRGCVIWSYLSVNPQGEEPVGKIKPFAVYCAPFSAE